MIETITNSVKETKKVADNLAQDLKKQSLLKHAFVIALEGNLGSGKTTFIQGLVAGLGIKETVLSPTFLILKQFPIPFKEYKNLYHIDAYRLKNSKELLELGFKDLVKNPENIIVIEWADKIKKILPKNILRIKFENLGKNKRKIVL
ncbi:MAG: tRNA (adenosine(37)-N6)-threonylcarbamoyltransferase complex ATPase subunit type 1 TsaE [Parcubacteria group bacterium]|nr:tRNA (adenosine(37)-N6)-threonylcarbamoyltransferase complex ATPase subunit type 1 TsaE [Parcubacteria group bacterium]